MSETQEKTSPILVAQSLLAFGLLFVCLWAGEKYILPEVKDNSLLALGILIVGGLVAGRVCQLIGLPSLTGHLGAGLILGPSGLTFLTNHQIDQLKLVNGLALAMIALQAGCEITKDMLQANLRGLIHSTWAHTVVIGLGMTAVFTLLSPSIDFVADLSFIQVVAVSALFAVIAISKSPAAVIAILSELKIKNSLANHALGIVIILDVVVLVIFAIVLTAAKSALDPDIPFSIAVLGHMMGELIASVSAGIFFGLFTSFYFRFIDKERSLFIVAISYGITAMCSYLHYDTLLVFVSAGFVVTNFSAQTHKVLHTIESLSSVVLIVFFATAGASLNVRDLMGIWQMVLLMLVARVIFTWISERLAHAIADSPQSLKSYGYTPFISQAGISIALAFIISDKIPGIGPKIATLTISVVTLNQLLGPVVFKWGLLKSQKMPEENN